VIVKRRPSVRPGKGRAAMYISGTPGASSEKPTPTVTPANNTWHRPGFASGSISKRFDSREKEKERDDPQKPVRVVSSKDSGASISFPGLFFFSSRKALKTSVATGDEAAAMAAMFQAQSANWEETQEKMSQLVFPAERVPCLVVLRVI
jgi:protein MPE1